MQGPSHCGGFYLYLTWQFQINKPECLGLVSLEGGEPSCEIGSCEDLHLQSLHFCFLRTWTWWGWREGLLFWEEELHSTLVERPGNQPQRISDRKQSCMRLKACVCVHGPEMCELPSK